MTDIEFRIPVGGVFGSELVANLISNLALHGYVKVEIEGPHLDGPIDAVDVVVLRLMHDAAPAGDAQVLDYVGESPKPADEHEGA